MKSVIITRLVHNLALSTATMSLLMIIMLFCYWVQFKESPVLFLKLRLSFILEVFVCACCYIFLAFVTVKKSFDPKFFFPLLGLNGLFIALALFVRKQRPSVSVTKAFRFHKEDIGPQITNPIKYVLSQFPEFHDWREKSDDDMNSHERGNLLRYVFDMDENDLDVGAHPFRQPIQEWLTDRIFFSNFIVRLRLKNKFVVFIQVDQNDNVKAMYFGTNYLNANDYIECIGRFGGLLYDTEIDAIVVEKEQNKNEYIYSKYQNNSGPKTPIEDFNQFIRGLKRDYTEKPPQE